MTDAHEDFSFEQAMTRLEEIVQALDGGDRPLEESLSLFEEGITLARHCSIRLNIAKGRLEMLVKDSEGNLGREELREF